MPRPPIHLLAAVVLTALVGVGAMLFGAFAVAVSLGAISLLAGAGVSGVVGILGLTSFAFGAAAVLGAVALWREASWAVPLAAFIHVATLAGVLIALETSGPGPNITGGLVVSIAGLAALAVEATSDAAPIGRRPDPRGLRSTQA
jgi:hypothetical protein